MRIVSREEFLAMPSGTAYMKFQPDIFEKIQIKGHTIGNDFYCGVITEDVKSESSIEYGEILDKAVADSSFEFEMDLYLYGRDGEFDEDQLFAVYSRSDVSDLAKRLSDLGAVG